MDHRGIARIRMRTQRLWGRGFDSPEEVVRFLGAVQAQEYPYAKWSLAQRSGRTIDADVQVAVADGRILRTHVLRPTWHFVLPEDIRWMLELTAPRIRARMARTDARIGLDERLFAKTNRIIARALEDGRHRTRAELSEALAARKVEATGQVLGHVVMRAELDGLVCSGAPRGKQQTYSLLDERAPKARAMERDAALAELVRRYFTSHGPATVKDFVWWAGLTTADARAGMEANELGSEMIDGRTYWFADAATARGGGSRIDLVQCYDEAVIAYAESRDVVASGLERTFPGGQAPLSHAVLLDGTLAGLWRHRLEPKRAVIEARPFGRFDRDAKAALDDAAARYERFLGLPVELVLGG